jgi:hypothetical protein
MFDVAWQVPPRTSRMPAGWYFGDASPFDEAVASPADAVAVERHHEYLVRMSLDKVVPAEVSAKARAVWELARKAVPGLPVPIAVAYDGGPIHYTWDNGRQVIALEALSGNQPCEWYVSDRQSGQFDGGDFDLSSGLPEPVLATLNEYLLPHPTGPTDGNR